MATDPKVKAACKIVGCRVGDLLKHRLTEDSVVLIVGPGGKKYIVPFSDLDAPPPVTTQVAAKEEPVKATRTRAPAKKSRAKKASA